MREQFTEHEFGAASLGLIAICNHILEEYTAQGYDLSLRQLYYQLVATGRIPNTEESYKRIGRLVSDARLAGYLDWDHIVDRGRETVEPGYWDGDNPINVLDAARRAIRIDKWSFQGTHVEVMAEKDAVSGILEPVCEKLEVPFTANRGYASQSLLYRRSQIIDEKLDEGKNVVILYLGDHDPSGLDMDRDIEERVLLFTRFMENAYDHEQIDVQRVALTKEQIRLYNPPPNPAKLTDSRAAAYVKRHGPKSWELDALEPRVLAKLVEEAVLEHRDEAKWQEALSLEAMKGGPLTTAIEKLKEE